MAKSPAIIVDINGTLSDTANVVNFLRGPRKDWKSFFDKMNSVPPNKMVVEFMERFRRDHKIILVSGAPDIYRRRTTEWLEVHKIKAYDMMFMRPAWDKRPGWQMKKTLYEKNLKNMFRIKLVLDDKQDAVDMWMNLGLTCWKLTSDADLPNEKSQEPGKRFAHLARTQRVRH